METPPPSNTCNSSGDTGGRGGARTWGHSRLRRVLLSAKEDGAASCLWPIAPSLFLSGAQVGLDPDGEADRLTGASPAVTLSAPHRTLRSLSPVPLQCRRWQKQQVAPNAAIIDACSASSTCLEGGKKKKKTRWSQGAEAVWPPSRERYLCPL